MRDMRWVSRAAMSRYGRLPASSPSSFWSRYNAFCTASSGLFISCAIDAARRPVAASFSESNSTCSSRRRSSSRRRPMSCMTETIAITAPRASRISVALDADLLLGGLQPLPSTCELLADMPDIGDVLQDRDGAAHADPIVRDWRRDDFVDELLALDRIDERDLAASDGAHPLQLPRRE